MWASRKKPSGKTGQNVGVGPDMWHILPIGTALSFYLLEDYMPSLATCSLFVKRSTKGRGLHGLAYQITVLLASSLATQMPYWHSHSSPKKGCSHAVSRVV